ncbi:MAG TPA: PASTA domain-containing protein [Steroidobacter sp.]
MAIGVNWAEIWAPVWGPVWVSTLVEVPNVVGETQADGTSILEAAGFVVAVETAHSSSVAAGKIISQSPSAGSEASAGATVTITVSLGEQAQEFFTGGFAVAFEREQARRRREARERAEREAEAERIEEETTREIARLLREQEARDARRDELDRLSRLVGAYARRGVEATLSDRVQKAIARAAAKRTTWALLALEREMRRAQEEERFILEALRLALDHD